MTTEKRRPGRPPTIKGEARPEILRVRATTAERNLMQNAANQAGQTLAVWMHDRLVAAAKRAHR